MNRDNIIRMAREAGLSHGTAVLPHNVEVFAALVAAAEREECAKVALDYDQYAIAPAAIAKAIRARGEHGTS